MQRPPDSRLAPPQTAAPIESIAMSRIRLCEACVKMLRSNIFINHPKSPDTEKWNFMLKQGLDPQANRPRRAVEQGEAINSAFDPRFGRRVDPAVMRENYDVNVQHTHSVLTSTSVIPPDGKIELFGGRGVGLIFDMRMCDFKDEQFVFETEAMTFNDWWLREDDQSKKAQQMFHSISLNRLRDILLAPTNEIRPYNEALAGINAFAICGIALHYSQDDARNDEAILIDKLTAIDRRVYCSRVLGVNLPIVIINPPSEPREYTIAEQNADIEKYLAKYPESPKAHLLKELLEFNLHYPTIDHVLIGQDDHRKPIKNMDVNLVFMNLVKKNHECLMEMNRYHAKLKALSYAMHLYDIPPDAITEQLRYYSEKLIADEKLHTEIDKALHELQTSGNVDKNALVYAAKDIKNLKRLFELLTNDTVTPDIKKVIRQIEHGKATINDIKELNSVDIDSVDREKTTTRVAELKLLYLIQRINSLASPSKHLKSILKLIKTSREQHKSPQETLRDVILKTETELTPPSQPMLSLFKSKQDEASLTVCDEICKDLKAEPVGLLANMTVPTLSDQPLHNPLAKKL